MDAALITRWLPLVRRIARRVHGQLPTHDIELDDLVAVGTIGLSQALTRFDSAKGNKFETYAAWRIRGAMLDELRAQDHLARSHRRELKVGGDNLPKIFTLQTDDRDDEETHGIALVDRRAQRRTELLEISDIWETAAAVTTHLEFQVLLMRYLDALPWHTIGRSLGRSPQWALNTHSQAIERLRRRLRRSCA